MQAASGKAMQMAGRPSFLASAIPDAKQHRELVTAAKPDSARTEPYILKGKKI